MTTQQQGDPPSTGAPNRIPIIVLSVVSSALLLTVLGLLFHFVQRGATAPPTGLQTTGPVEPVSTPSSHATGNAEAPPADDAAAHFAFVSAETEVQCPAGGDKPEIRFSWETEHAAEVWYTVGDRDAIDAAYQQVPLSGSQDDLTDEHLFPCGHREYEDYTLTLLGADGERVSETFRVIDLNWNGGSGD
jgi:hypothetical protein